MIQSLYTAVSGLRAQQVCIDVIGNNVANLGTTGFKSSRADFSDAYYAAMQPQREASGALQRGSGMGVGAVTRMMDQGSAQVTGCPTDFMLDGSGYFTLAGPGGQVYYTKDGSFRVAAANGGNYLVSAEGYFVLGADNRPISIPAGGAGLAADPSGNLYAGGVRFAAFGIATFTNPEGLMDAGGNKMAASAASGPAVASAGTVVRQGWLEGSNVDLAGEMVRLIQAQKAYAMLGAAVRTADEMEAAANRLPE